MIPMSGQFTKEVSETWAMGYIPWLVQKLEVFLLTFFDTFTNEWDALCLQEYDSCPSYAVFMKGEICFIGNKFAHTLHLGTLESVDVNIIDYVPTGAAVVLHQGQIYFCGSDIFHYSKKMFRFYPASGKCLSVGEMPEEGCTHTGVVSYGDKIYVTGGCNFKAILNSSFTWNVQTGVFASIQPMLMRRQGHGCAMLGEKIYVCGGSTRGEPFAPFTSTAEVYDPSAGKWSYVSPMNGLRLSLTTFVLRGEIYAVESDPQSDNSFEIEVFDPRKNIWRCGGFLPPPSGRFTAAIGIMESAIVLRSM